MLSTLPANPFLRKNPFYVPQRFYSQPRVAENSSHNHSANKYAAFASVSMPRLEIERYSQSALSAGLLVNSTQQHQRAEKVVKKGPNGMESPFMRKSLLQNNFLKVQESNQKQEIWGLPIDKSSIQIRNQNQLKQNKQQLDILVTSPKGKVSLQASGVVSPNKQKYLSSELKIKLKSQTYIEEQGEAMSGQTSKKEQAIWQYPSKFKWRGKIFVLRQVL